MGTPVVIVPSGGRPVTVATNGFGIPVTEATNGYGIPVTEDPNGNGLAVVGITFGPDVTAPTITSSNAVSWPENSAFSHALTASEAVTWTKTGGADTALFTLVGSTLTMTAKNFESPVDAGANNTYVVQVTATDAASNATNQTLTVTITDVDDTAPTITSAAAVNLAEGTALSHALTASEAVTWTKTGGADTALFTLAGSTLSMTAKDYELPVDADANNTYVVQVTATDAALNATNQTITVTVTDVVDTLAALTLSADEIQSGAAENTVVGALVGKYASSSLSMTDTAGGRFKLSGSNVVAGATATDYATDTSHSITVRETWAPFANSPRDTVFTIDVVEVGAATYRLILGGVVTSSGSREMITSSGMVGED